MKYLKLTRYQNLILLAFMQVVFRYGFLKLQNIPLGLTDFQYALLVLSTVLIAGAGYVINAIFDQNTDAENKHKVLIVGKSISESKAYNFYVALNISGVALGFYLSNAIGKPGFAVLFILIASLLYFYATSLKQMILVGNVIVALLLSFSILIIAVFDLFPVTNPENQPQIANLFSVLTDYVIMAFIINFIREIVKDLEDIHGDNLQGMKTLPIILGLAKTAKLVSFLSLIPIFLILRYCNNYFMINDLFLTTLYTLITIVAPLIYVAIKSWTANTQPDFHHLSLVLKIIVLFGVISIAVLTYNIHHHA
jgi:4-hydroxybenzoate polyprenyltransferase